MVYIISFKKRGFIVTRFPQPPKAPRTVGMFQRVSWPNTTETPVLKNTDKMLEAVYGGKPYHIPKNPMKAWRLSRQIRRGSRLEKLEAIYRTPNESRAVSVQPTPAEVTLAPPASSVNFRGSVSSRNRRKSEHTDSSSASERCLPRLPEQRQQVQSFFTQLSERRSRRDTLPFVEEPAVTPIRPARQW